MKRVLLFFAFLLFASVSARAETADPTVPTAAMADLLKRNFAAADVALHALVVGASEEGVALLGATPKSAKAVRRGSVVSGTVEGVRVSAEIKSVTPAGVELASTSSVSRIFLPGSFTALPAPTNRPPEFLRHLESEKVPIDRLMRLIADQTGVNVSSSDATAEKTVTIFLRNVTAEAAVEEICRATGLWFRRDPDGGVIRVTTMDEYSENLSSFREETTKTFTLLYPNVIEIASVVYGLYPDRTLVSLGEEEFQEDAEYDLSRRFRRFRVIEENGNSQFMDMQAPRSSSSGTASGGGEFSFSRGNAVSRLTQWDRLRTRGQIGGGRRGAYWSPEAMLSAAAAKRLETAARAGDTNAYEVAYQQSATAAANIFVSMSRKNNMLIVRTSDVKVMDEITRLVKSLDVPTPMVLMELRILELELDDNFDAEFSYAFNRKGGNVTLADSNPNSNVLAGFPGFSPVAADPSLASAMSFQVVDRNVAARIQLLQEDGKIKTLSTPTLLTANNEVSRIFDGEERPMIVGVSSQTTQNDSQSITTPITEFEWRDVGTMLLVTPNINADRTVTLRLVQETSQQSGQSTIPIVTTVGVDEAPVDVIASRSVAGTFVAKDGMTVMAGGLISETEKEVYTRTPVLGSIPWVGVLFRGTEKVKKRTEMIILIKPHVIMTPMEGGKISSELMKALSDHPAADGRPNMGVFREGEDPVAKDHGLMDDVRNLTGK